jgi:hypothetical protein
MTDIPGLWPSVWRPLVPVVEDCPLAFCDRRTVAKTDLVDVDKIHEDHWEEGCFIKHNPEHEWYWLSKQTSEEVSVFVTWDSDHESFHSACKSNGSSFLDGNNFLTYLSCSCPTTCCVPCRSIDKQWSAERECGSSYDGFHETCVYGDRLVVENREQSLDKN